MTAPLCRSQLHLLNLGFGLGIPVCTACPQRPATLSFLESKACKPRGIFFGKIVMVYLIFIFLFIKMIKFIIPSYRTLTLLLVYIFIKKKKTLLLVYKIKREFHVFNIIFFRKIFNSLVPYYIIFTPLKLHLFC